MIVRLVDTGGVYEDDWLYLVGNAFVFLHEAVGTEFNPATQSALETTTGVYDATGPGVDHLVGGVSGSIPLAGYVPPIVSAGLLFVLALGALGGAVRYFERTDVE